MAKKKKKKKHHPGRDIGLELMLLISRHLFDTEDLHFGYWREGQAPRLQDIRAAQEAYAELILSHLPAAPIRVLDVGCGAGTTAERMLDRGYEVQCVSPPSELLERAKQRLGERAVVHEAPFEAFVSDERFDVVLFSESFQYVDCAEGLSRARSLLAPGGRIVICDFFRRSDQRHSPIGGGHRFWRFEESYKALGLVVVEDVDITDRTAPTMDLVGNALDQIIKPGYESCMSLAYQQHRWSTRLVRWMLRKRIAKMEHKYLSGHRTGETFARFKTYRLFVLQPAD